MNSKPELTGNNTPPTQRQVLKKNLIFFQVEMSTFHTWAPGTLPGGGGDILGGVEGGKIRRPHFGE
jgi:hypothetical protein